jgi:hypothetical protein
MLRDLVRQDGRSIGRKRVQTLMKKMGIEALSANPIPASTTPPIVSTPTCSGEVSATE